jgi:hypothetical protein
MRKNNSPHFAQTVTNQTLTPKPTAIKNISRKVRNSKIASTGSEKVK